MPRTPLPEGSKRKLIEFDADTWQALHMLARDRMATVRELAFESGGDPEHALTDGAQSITPPQFAEMMKAIKRIAAAVDREV